MKLAVNYSPQAAELVHQGKTETDWRALDWALTDIFSGEWREPEVVAFEYGGIGPSFEWRSKPDVLAEQVPRLYTRVHQGIPAVRQ